MTLKFVNTLNSMPSKAGEYSCLVNITDRAGIFNQTVVDMQFDGESFRYKDAPVDIAGRTRVAGWREK